MSILDDTRAIPLQRHTPRDHDLAEWLHRIVGGDQAAFAHLYDALSGAIANWPPPRSGTAVQWMRWWQRPSCKCGGWQQRTIGNLERVADLIESGKVKPAGGAVVRRGVSAPSSSRRCRGCRRNRPTSGGGSGLWTGRKRWRAHAEELLRTVH
jgi:hypothetical protein